jgi:hypothetical protein
MSRPSHMTPVLALLCAACLLALLPAAANAEIVVKIHGTGGVQVIPPKICPNPPWDPVCAEVKFTSQNPTQWEVTDSESNVYDVVVSEALPLSTTDIQGSELDDILESITPRQ